MEMEDGHRNGIDSCTFLSQDGNLLVMRFQANAKATLKNASGSQWLFPYILVS